MIHMDVLCCRTHIAVIEVIVDAAGAVFRHRNHIQWRHQQQMNCLLGICCSYIATSSHIDRMFGFLLGVKYPLQCYALAIHGQCRHKWEMSIYICCYIINCANDDKHCVCRAPSTHRTNTHTQHIILLIIIEIIVCISMLLLAQWCRVPVWLWMMAAANLIVITVWSEENSVGFEHII